MSTSFDIKTTPFDEIATFFYDHGYVICENALGLTSVARLEQRCCLIRMCGTEDARIGRQYQEKRCNLRLREE